MDSLVRIQQNRVIPSGLIAALGIIMGAAALVYVDTWPNRPWWWTLEFVLAGLFPAILMYSGYWLASSDFDSDDLWQVLTWTVVGIVSLTALTSLLFLHQQAEGSHLVEPMFIVILLAMGGALFGLTTAVAHLRPPVAWLGDLDVSVPRPVAMTAVERPVFGEGMTEVKLQRHLEIIEYTAARRKLTVAELAAELSATADNPFAEDFERIQRELYQFDLPEVAETGRIDFDPQTEIIEYTGQASM